MNDNLKVPNSSNSIHPLLKNMIGLLNFLLNPNHFLIRNKKIQKYINNNFDLRSSPYIRIVGRKIIYFFRTLFLLFTDNIAIVASWLFVNKVSNLLGKNSFSSGIERLFSLNFLVAILVINLFICLAARIYTTQDNSRRLRDVITAFSLSYLAFFWLLFILDKVEIDSLTLFLNLGSLWFVNLLIVGSARLSIFKLIVLIRNYALPLRRKVLLAGTKEDIANCQKLFMDSTSFDIAATLDLSSCHDKYYFQKIYQQIYARNLDEVFICSWDKIERQTRLFWNLQTSGISWRILPIKKQIPQKDIELANIDGIPTIRYPNSAIMGIDFFFKRIFDLLVASLLLLILGLPMLFIGLAIKLDSPGSIFYRQIRIGLHGKRFQVWKFRTMVANASQLQKELEAKNQVSGGILFKMIDDPRITRVGKFLRRYSLDELPQLFNVIKGEMSLVGPRPLPVRDVAKFEEHHHFRHEVLPGITGLWQVSGRSDTDSEKVFDLDFQYIQNWSLTFDTKILFKTVQVVLFGKGAY